MNEHIEFVKEWLADPTSKTQAELEANAEAARTAALCVDLDAWYAANASRTAALCVDLVAAFWVREYEELTK